MSVPRRHWPFLALAALAACLLFTGLGRDYLWEDEGDTAVLAQSILQHGVPVAWDGVTFSDPDYGQRLKFGFVMISHPWLQYYAAAASFGLFGESPWAARLPFALAGLATILLVYAMALRLLGSRAVAVSAALLLTVSVQFLLFSRQARNYSLNALLTTLLLWQFLRLNSWKRTIAFTVTGILLFHAHAIGLAAVAMLGVVSLVYRPARPMRRWFWPAAIVIVLYATPWLIWSQPGQATNTAPVTSVWQLFPRLLQFAFDYASVAPVIGVVVLSIVCWLLRRGNGRLFTPAEAALLTCIGAICTGEAVVMAATHTRNDIWIVGLHHTPALIPLTVLSAAVLIVKVSGRHRVLLVALCLVFAFTRLGQATPWGFWADPVAIRSPDRIASLHVPQKASDRLLRTTQVQFVKSLGRSNPGVIASVSDFLNAHAAPGDIVITNYEWEALYFHTRLPQGARVSPSFPIYRVARARGLPKYVFGADGVRWIVWRRAWPAYFAEQDIDRLLRRLRQAGVTTELVASFHETLFENRENIHFRRYAGGTYVFPWYGPLPDVQIYRVDWESDIEANHQRAEALLLENRFPEAVVLYEKYLESRPADLDAWTKLGIASVGTGDLEQATRAFRHVVDIAPDDGVARRNLANALFDSRNPAEALVHAERAATLRPDDPDIYDLLGRVLAVQGRLDDATAQFARALQINPAHADAREHLDRVNQLQGR
jgi:hypothetical protein